MKCCSNGRFLNEQTYLRTVCCQRQPCKPRKKRDCKCQDEPYMEYTYCGRCGKLTLRCDKHSTGICMDIKHCCEQDKCEKR
ncbi:MAG: hypothetical protein J1F68_05060 [Clostridiales bacterium]|nr:hypothetical protein [Clostridiales bacterium]